MDLLAFNSLLFLLSFIGFGAGTRVLPEGPLDAMLGKNVTFETLIDDTSLFMIIWNYNFGGEQTHVATSTPTTLNVNTPYQGRAWINRTNGYLYMGPLQAKDSGDYSVNLVSPDGVTLTGEIKLRVLEPVSGVAIKSDLPEAIEHNSTVVLTCLAKGSYLTFSWINGTSPIVADDKRLVVKDEPLSSTLTIKEVLRTDLVGPIYCTAANKLETEKSAPFNLTVYYGPDEVAITPPNPPPALPSGSDFNLSCSAQSSPAATFTWYHGKKMIAETPVLTLKEIEKQSGKKVGEYTCRASNEKTKRVVASEAVSFTVMEAISGVEITGPTSVLIAGNSSVNISCQAGAGTVKTTTWLKDGKPLSASSRLVFAEDLSSMVINMVQKEDNGEYVCQLSNPVNKDQASYKMVVNYGPEPVVVAGPKDIEVNHQFKLICSAASVPPANFTWKFNGTVTAVKTADYLIEKASYKNSGTYTCEAHNDVTGKTTRYTHTVVVESEDEGLSDGAIAGIVIAILVALGLAIGLIMYCRQRVPVESPY